MTLDGTFIYVLVGITSALTFTLGVKRFRMEPAVLRAVLSDLSECVGAFVLFFLINVGIGLPVAFLIRTVWKFFPLYVMTDGMLVIMSAVQGFVFQLWWRRSRPNGPPMFRSRPSRPRVSQ